MKRQRSLFTASSIFPRAPVPLLLIMCAFYIATAPYKQCLHIAAAWILWYVYLEIEGSAYAC